MPMPRQSNRRPPSLNKERNELRDAHADGGNGPGHPADKVRPDQRNDDADNTHEEMMTEDNDRIKPSRRMYERAEATPPEEKRLTREDLVMLNPGIDQSRRLHLWMNAMAGKGRIKRR